MATSNISATSDTVASLPLYSIKHTAPEVAERLRVSLRTVRTLIKRGDIGTIRVGHKVFVTEQQIREYELALHEVAR